MFIRSLELCALAISIASSSESAQSSIVKDPLISTVSVNVFFLVALLVIRSHHPHIDAKYKDDDQEHWIHNSLNALNISQITTTVNIISAIFIIVQFYLPLIFNSSAVNSFATFELLCLSG
jgi:hypothetical protein